MPRTPSTTLTAIFALGTYTRRETVRVYLASGQILNLSRGAVTRGGIVYQDYIRGVSDFVKSETEIDRLTVTFQNVNSELGLLTASDARLFDYAVAEYGLIYSNLAGTLTEDIPQVFRAVVSEAQISERDVTLTLITDFETLENVCASRGLKEKCPWAYKNGRECTSVSSLSTCPKDRAACKVRGKEWEFGGWEFFEEPVDSAPGTAGNSGYVYGLPRPKTSTTIEE